MESYFNKAGEIVMKNSFIDIRERITKDIEDNKKQPSTVPQPSMAGQRIGTVVSKPGTEKVMIDASTFQMMECESSSPKVEKRRYCMVEKNTAAVYGNQFINSAGFRTHVITHDMYILLLGILNGASRQIQSLTFELKNTKEQRDVYKLTIDALRKNGIID
jgi:hypothetical protein